MGQWIISIILRFYPWDFRNRFAGDLQEAITQDGAQARTRGGLFWRTRFWTGVILDNLGAAWRLRRDQASSLRDSASRTGTLMEDIRQGRRMFLRNARFQVAAVLVMAMGIGATTAAFAVVDGVLLKGLPYPDAERLVRVGIRIRPMPDFVGPLSERVFVALRNDLSTVQNLVAIGTPTRVLRGPGDPQEVAVGTVSEGYLDLLGARPMLGRLLQPQDHEATAAKVAVLSPAFFETHFGSDPTVLGRVVNLNDEPMEIVGVVSPEFFPPPTVSEGSVALWTPLGLSQRELQEGSFHLSSLGVMRPGATEESVIEDADRTLTEAYPPGDGPGFMLGTGVAPLRSLILGESGLPILLAQAGVTLLLLLTCVNVASLLLARASDRRREMAVRAAMGARRGRMIRQLLSESLFLASIAGAGGVALALALLRAFKALAPEGIPRMGEVGVDGRVLAFALILSLVAGVLFGLLPALTSSRTDLTKDLGEAGRGGTTGRARAGLRQILVAGEVALAVVLALGAGLMANSFFRLTRVDPGFRQDGLASAMVDVGRSQRDREEWVPFFRQFLEEGRALPGVTAATLATQAPFTEDGMLGRYTPQDLDPSFGEMGVFLIVQSVSEGFFSTMGIPILEGRPIEATDGEGGEPVVVVNQAFLRTYWPDDDSGLNRTIKPGGPEAETTDMRVVGIAGDTRNDPAAEPEPTIYVHLDREPWRRMNLLLRTDGDPALLAPPIREIVRRLDPGLPVSRIATVSSLGASTLVAPRFYALLAVSFGFLALSLALVGVYGTTAYTAMKRTREMGIRMALGADRSRLVGGILTGTLRTALVGVSLGLGGGALGVRFLASYLFGIEPLDLPTFLSVAVLVGGTALLAAYFPARRAAGINPADSLRVEA